MLVALLGVMTSCEDDDPVPPSLQITSGTEVTATPNSQVTIVWRADAGDANLATLTVQEGNSPITGWNETEIPNAQNDTYVDSATVNIGSDDLTFTVIVTDSDGEIDSKAVNVTVEGEPAGGAIENQTAKILSDLENASGGSFYSVGNAEVMTYSEAQSNSGDVDLVYYYGSTNQASICAPNDTEAEVFLDAGSNSYLQQLSTRNATDLAMSSVSKADFEAATDDLIITSNVPGSTSTAVNQLSVDNIFYFETTDGRMGLALVTDVTGSQGSSTITLEIKVQAE